MLMRLERFKYKRITTIFNMPINPLVCKPERIRDIAELEDILERMEIYRREYVPNHSEVGVLLIQNRQLGAIYMIESRENAEKEISKPVLSNPRTPEWGVKFYPHSYFVELRERLNGDGQKNYS